MRRSGRGQRGRALYLSVDGLLQPLGHSQVVRVIEALAERGYEYDVLSLERRRDLDRPGAREALETQLGSVGVRWFPAPYDEAGGGRAAMGNLASLTKRALARAGSGGYALLHARSYVAGLAALAVKTLTRVPYVFDARGLWIDERLEEGRWFKKAAALRSARRLEHALYQGAAAIVTLTELHADDVRCGAFGDVRGTPVIAIPTCADFAEFTLGAPPADSSGACRDIPEAVQQWTQGRRVVGIVGSLNASYLAAESAQLASAILDRDSDARLLVLSAQADDYRTLLRTAGIGEHRYAIHFARHQAMPAWLRTMTWGMLLLQPSRAKRGSMPTKLAEFFGAGVRPIQFGCNVEVASWVSRAGSGIVLPGTAPKDIARTAEEITRREASADDLVRARAVAAPHFSLTSGVRRYAELLETLNFHHS